LAAKERQQFPAHQRVAQQSRSQARRAENHPRPQCDVRKAAAAIEPGHWIFNPYNWNAVGSFAKRMPWNSVALTLDEG
jgi:hypothetical protein